MSRGRTTCTCLSETFTLTRSGRTLTCERYNPVITVGIENVNEGGLNFLTLSRVSYWLASRRVGLYFTKYVNVEYNWSWHSRFGKNNLHIKDRYWSIVNVWLFISLYKNILRTIRITILVFWYFSLPDTIIRTYHIICTESRITFTSYRLHVGN